MKQSCLSFSASVLVLLMSSVVSLQAQTKTFKGVVYHDMNENNIRDKGEEGIPGVAVSNQADVVLTDAAGKYELRADDESIVFITKPAAYRIPVNAQQIQLFYYIHQPQGSPKQKYDGIRSTDALKQDMNFPLIRYEEPDSFEVIVFSDPQPASKTEIDFIRDDVVTELAPTSAVFGITLGDIMFDDLSLFPYYNSVVAQLGIPFYNIAGNHDTNQDAKDDRYALETFKKYFGPPYYSFDYGQVHFIVLDDVEWRGPDERYRGFLGERQLKWLKNDLAHVDDQNLVVLLMHIPIYTMYGDGGNVNIVDRDRLFHILKDRENNLALAGHMHMIEHNFLDKSMGWEGKKPFHLITCAAVSGSWWNGPKDVRGIPVADQRDGVPNGYHLFRFSGNRYIDQFRAAGKDADHQIRISKPQKNISTNKSKGAHIIANVFNGNQRSVVEFSIDDGAFQPMKQVVMEDPYIVNLHKQYNKEYPEWVKSEKTNHIWSGLIQKNLPPGVHKINVRTVDMYGHEYNAVKIIEVH